MKKGTRITLTRKQADSVEGQRLLSLMLDICHDGALDLQEVVSLHDFLCSTPADFAAIPYLRSLTRQIIADGAIDAREALALKKAFIRVAPKEVRAVIATHLESIGLPNEDVDGEPRWHRDPATRKQIDYIVDLGGVPKDPMTKGEASELIDDLLARRPATPRQIMLARFFGYPELANRTKDEASLWIDELFAQNESRERAWTRFKRETNHDPFETDVSVVPIGAYRRFMDVSYAHQDARNSQRGLIIALGVTGLIALLALIAAIRLI